MLSLFLYNSVARPLLTRPFTWLFHLEVIGAENWPAAGPALVASNHGSNFDPVIVGIAFPGEIRWMAKSELWKVPVLGWLISKLGAFPVKRGEADREAIREARSLLQQGFIVGMFPEGTRQRDGNLGEAQPGAGLLALEPGIPVIPVRVRGTERIICGGRPRRPRITVSIGPAVDMDIEAPSRGRAYKEASRRIMEAIARL